MRGSYDDQSLWGNGDSTYGRLLLFDAFINNGWLGVLKCIDQNVYLAYAFHAKRDCVVEKPTAEIAAAIGHRYVGHVKVARARLKKIGLLDYGRGSADVVKVLPAPALTPELRVLAGLTETPNRSPKSKTPNRSPSARIRSLSKTPNRSPSKTPNRSPTPRDTSTQEIRETKQSEGEERGCAAEGVDPVESIYQAYPLKVDRSDALKAIAKALKEPPPAGHATRYDYLLAQTTRYAAIRLALKAHDRAEFEQYTPHPATWFNKRRYEQEHTWRGFRKAATNGNGRRPSEEERGFCKSDYKPPPATVYGNET